MAMSSRSESVPATAENKPVPAQVGDEVVVEVGAWAHGGHCVARHEGLVIFVRHCLPGERVRVRIDRVRKRLARRRDRSARRVTEWVSPPCQYSGPGGCGGCDFQHVALPAQRAAKTAIVLEQLTRLGRVPAEHPALAGFEVESVDESEDGLGWRTRVVFAVGRPYGRAYFYANTTATTSCRSSNA